MARGPEDDPQVTDLQRYRKAREQAERRRRAASPPKRPPGQSFLGSNPRAGLILAAIAAVLAALYLIPRFL
ncbi:MAG: hypothetical protein GC203_07580 [Phenylobacterium sp.]|uniref:hypothetical protein n=1 Tax=Phenylobacterium sp. TaxID=1871053 RepID=UPI0025F6719A|nr:hypothetical protein [Phenylobacterium sp.]MBI1197706.1 hypothetical protein [Phenylobacterium sp.]